MNKKQDTSSLSFIPRASGFNSLPKKSKTLIFFQKIAGFCFLSMYYFKLVDQSFLTRFSLNQTLILILQ